MKKDVRDRMSFYHVNSELMMSFIEKENPWFFPTVEKYAREKFDIEKKMRDKQLNVDFFHRFTQPIFNYAHREYSLYNPALCKSYEDYWIFNPKSLTLFIMEYFVRVPSFGSKKKDQIIASLERFAKTRNIDWDNIYCKKCRRFWR